MFHSSPVSRSEEIQHVPGVKINVQDPRWPYKIHNYERILQIKMTLPHPIMA